ncbi:hypothetical protein COV93_02875 [Candidatus Woesearchaeota archaeon CG11_big_fil_rev_8_21_14_0_20_43_8]|nr:MAG: hypothetical protein COV93_02875 [Candidatus Woesearchaeota archaeon CG11_big_fil_rev_8_21_14_0_20_43_8]PIO04791.1 MAG: hypothetical protein COT47_07510 [Candidatus Woesearchaeota archaeon CG08_land_8_20_14_0_20_43_7]
MSKIKDRQSNFRLKNRDYFNKTSSGFIREKREHPYYLSELIKTFKETIPPGKKILDVGCGTGDLLSSLKAKNGMGIDISPGMVNIAKKRFKHYSTLKFKVSAAENLRLNQTFDIIILADVLEHVTSVEKTIQSVRHLCTEDTRVYIWVTNYMMSWISEVAEFFNLKHEGPHRWPKQSEIRSALHLNNFGFDEKYRLILPLNVPLISTFVNRLFHKLPVIRRFGYIWFLECHLK